MQSSYEACCRQDHAEGNPSWQAIRGKRLSNWTDMGKSQYGPLVISDLQTSARTVGSAWQAMQGQSGYWASVLLAQKWVYLYIEFLAHSGR